MSHDNTNEPGNNPTPEKKIVSPPMRRKQPLPPRDNSAGPDSADHLTTLAHDLSNLIDGSMRWLSLAVTKIAPDDSPSATDPNEQLDTARQQIDTVQQTLHRMSTMVNTAMRSNTVPIGSPILGVSEAITTAMAIDHAVDVVRPLASQAGVRIEIDIHPDAGNLPVGPLYTVVLNALFNGVQSIQRATRVDALDPGGLIHIDASVDTAHDELVIAITDDGAGLTPGISPEQPFKHGYTTGNQETFTDNTQSFGGVGLAISRQIIEQLEGLITLTNRPDHQNASRPGAILTARVPVPHDDTSDQTIG